MAVIYEILSFLMYIQSILFIVMLFSFALTVVCLSCYLYMYLCIMSVYVNNIECL